MCSLIHKWLLETKILKALNDTRPNSEDFKGALD